jgi:hypothetical protein
MPDGWFIFSLIKVVYSEIIRYNIIIQRRAMSRQSIPCTILFLRYFFSISTMNTAIITHTPMSLPNTLFKDRHSS